MNKKLLILIPTLIIGFASLWMMNSNAMASTGGHDEWQSNSQDMHDHIKARLDKLENRLEIKATQQTVWTAYANSVEALADHKAKTPGADADAATVAHFRAERAAEMAGKLSGIADATTKLQAALDDNQAKVFNEATRHYRHGHHNYHSRHAHCGSSS